MWYICLLGTVTAGLSYKRFIAIRINLIYQHTFNKPLVIVVGVTERFQREKRLAADNGIG